MKQCVIIKGTRKGKNIDTIKAFDTIQEADYYIRTLYDDSVRYVTKYGGKNIINGAESSTTHSCKYKDVEYSCYIRRDSKESYKNMKKLMKLAKKKK